MIGKILTKEQQRLLFESMSNFLPYNLRVKTKTGFSTMSTLNEYCVNSDHEEPLTYESGESLELLPMLRTLSNESLFEEIIYRGEKFIPMLNLCDISYQHLYLTPDSEKNISDNIYNSGLIDKDIKAVFFKSISGEEIGLSFDILESAYFFAFSRDSDGSAKDFHCTFSSLLFKELRKWNFDVDGLIPLGLATESSEELNKLNNHK